jgi:hypothetical protein
MPPLPTQGEPLEFVPLRADANDWMANRTEAQMRKYAEVKLMPAAMVLDTWKRVKKRLTGAR